MKAFFDVVDWNKIAKNYESAKEKLAELAKYKVSLPISVYYCDND